jgi:hypothetical protein
MAAERFCVRNSNAVLERGFRCKMVLLAWFAEYWRHRAEGWSGTVIAERFCVRNSSVGPFKWRIMCGRPAYEQCDCSFDFKLRQQTLANNSLACVCVWRCCCRCEGCTKWLQRQRIIHSRHLTCLQQFKLVCMPTLYVQV